MNKRESPEPDMNLTEGESLGRHEFLAWLKEQEQKEWQAMEDVQNRGSDKEGKE